MSRPINDGLTNSQRYYRRHMRGGKNRLRTAQWRAENPGRARECCREYYARNAEKERQRKREYYQAVRKPADRTFHGKLAGRIKKEQSRCLKAGGRVTKAEWLELLARYDNRCVYCGASGNLEMDHILAITKGGQHEPANIVPACKPCNASKGNAFAVPPRIKRAACG